VPQLRDKTASLKNWQISSKRFVGFIDIMGFKDLVARSDHNQVYQKLKKVFSSFKEESVDEPFHGKNPNKIFIFSDSIILFSKDESNNQMKELFRNMRVLMERLLVDTIPFRGGIAFGEITVDEQSSIFFGQPLIDAFQLSEELLFYGIALHHSAEMMIISDSLHKKRFLFYNSKMKNGSGWHNLVSPFSRFFKKNDIKDIIQAFRLLTSGHLRKYIDNTEDFLKGANEYQKSLETD
jgi:hypothetical protein